MKKFKSYFAFQNAQSPEVTNFGIPRLRCPADFSVHNPFMSRAFAPCIYQERQINIPPLKQIIPHFRWTQNKSYRRDIERFKSDSASFNKQGEKNTEIDSYLEEEEEVHDFYDEKGSSQFQQHFAKYLPQIVIERFLHDPKPLKKEEIVLFPAAVAFIDISGFTALSEQLNREHEESSAEMLNKYISDYFRNLIRVILGFRGDIIKFAGDAMLVIWRNTTQLQDFFTKNIDLALERLKKVRPNTTKKNLNKILGEGGVPLETLVWWAVSCCVAVLSKNNGFNQFYPRDDICLTLHIGVGAGELSGLFVGGQADQNNKPQWEFFVAGHPITQMAEAANEAKSGQCVLSIAAYNLLKPWLFGRHLSSGNFLVTDLLEYPILFPIPPLTVPKKSEECLKQFIPRLVQIRSAHTKQWHGEYRRVYIMFIKLPELDYDAPDVLSKLQIAVTVVQEIVQKLDGTIARLLRDDKGTRFKVAFGMPHAAHEDDGHRCIFAALSIQNRFSELDVRCAIGVTCGKAYCGDAGSKDRCEYTAVGFKVNIAARLMQKADEDGLGILCDQMCYEALFNWFDFDHSIDSQIKVKGTQKPIKIFRPLGHKARVTNELSDKDDDYNSSVVTPYVDIGSKFLTLCAGREEDLDLIQYGLDCIEAEEVQHTIIFEGIPGIGKSALVREVLRVSKKRGICSLIGSSSSESQTDSYFTYRSIFDLALRQLTSDNTNNTDDSTTQDSHRAVTQKQLFSVLEGEYRELASLLSPVLQMSLASSSIVKQMNEVTRARKTRDILVYLLQKVLHGRPLLLVIEDLQWLDQASWTLTLDIVQQITRIIVILTTRPLPTPHVQEFRTILRLENVHHVLLEPLSRDATRFIACNIIGVSEIPREITDFIYQKTHGLPLQLPSLIQSMVDDRMVWAENGVCKVAPELMESSFSVYPNCLYDTIIERIDRLSPEEEATLKVCSVIGMTFTKEAVRAVHPRSSNQDKNKSNHNQIKPNRDSLRDKKEQRDSFKKEDLGSPRSPKKKNNEDLLTSELSTLDASMFISVSVDHETNPTYVFRNEFFQEVSYKLLTAELRQRIHAKVGEFLEKQGNSSCEVLYRHWSNAGTRKSFQQKALDYGIKAGEKSLKMRSTEEASRYFSSSLAILRGLRPPKKDKVIESERHLLLKHDGSGMHTYQYCHALLAKTMYVCGRYREAIRHLELSLSRIDYPIPPKRFLHWHTTRVLGTIIRAVPALLKGGSDDYAIEYRASRLFMRLTHCCVLEGETWKAAYTGAKLVELAHAVSSDPMLLVGYAQCAYVGLICHMTAFAEEGITRAKELLTMSSNLTKQSVGVAHRQMGAFYAGRGDFKEAVRLIESSREVFRELGAISKWNDVTNQLGMIKHFQGKFKQAITIFESVESRARKDGEVRLEAVALFWTSLTMYFIEQGAGNLQLSVAHRLWQDSGCIEPGVETLIKWQNFWNSGGADLNIIISLCKDILDKSAMGEIVHSVEWFALYQYWFAALLLLEGLEISLKTGNKELQTMFQHHLNVVEKSLNGFCLSFSFAEGYGLVINGRCEWIRGRKREGLKILQKAIDVSLQYNTVVSLIEANFELGRRTNDTIKLKKAKELMISSRIKWKSHIRYMFFPSEDLERERSIYNPSSNMLSRDFSYCMSDLHLSPPTRDNNSDINSDDESNDISPLSDKGVHYPIRSSPKKGIEPKRQLQLTDSKLIINVKKSDEDIENDDSDASINNQNDKSDVLTPLQPKKSNSKLIDQESFILPYNSPSRSKILPRTLPGSELSRTPELPGTPELMSTNDEDISVDIGSSPLRPWMQGVTSEFSKGRRYRKAKERIRRIPNISYV